MSEFIQIRSPVIQLICDFSKMMRERGLILPAEYSELYRRLKIEFDNHPKLISRKFAAKELLGGITMNTLDFKIIPEARLTKYKVGGSIKLDENEIIEYLESVKVKGGDEMDIT
jgi:hypothetical protein